MCRGRAKASETEDLEVIRDLRLRGLGNLGNQAKTMNSSLLRAMGNHGQA